MADLTDPNFEELPLEPYLKKLQQAASEEYRSKDDYLLSQWCVDIKSESDVSCAKFVHRCRRNQATFVGLYHHQAHEQFDSESIRDVLPDAKVWSEFLQQLTYLAIQILRLAHLGFQAPASSPRDSRSPRLGRDDLLTFVLSGVWLAPEELRDLVRNEIVTNDPQSSVRF